MAMPISLPNFDEDLALYFREARHETVLDIGPGEGKYGAMLQRVQPQAKRIALEIDPSYIEQYKLGEIYDEVRVLDAARLLDQPEESFSAVIMGDCIEHMRKSVGVDLLNFLVYRSRILILTFPVQMPQNVWQGHSSEAHLSVWTRHDFAGFDHLYLQRDLIHLCLIRGYLSRTIEWMPAAVMQRFGYPNVTAFYNEKPERWELADVETLRRETAVRELRAVIPDPRQFLLVDEMQSGLMAELPQRTLPFLERIGQYWGMPTNDAEAIAEVERQCAAGVHYLVFAWPTFWALTCYPGLIELLDTRHRCLLKNERLVIFELQHDTDPRSASG
jgi:SAM-dependent methyltransferase